MAQLSSVIGSILRDIILAQHEANLYSLALSESYGKDGKVKDFQLPNVVVSDMELEIKYGVINASESQQQFNIKYNQFRQFLKELCEETAKVVISSVVTTVITSDIERNEDDMQFFFRLKKESDLQKEFTAFLSRNMINSLRSNLFEAIDTSNGMIKTDVVTSKLMDVVRKKFLYDTDLNELFADKDGEQLREDADKNALQTIEGLVMKLSKDTNFKKSETFPALDVAVTADELVKIPEEAIHSFKLKFSPASVSITQLEEDHWLDDFVMQ